MATPTVRASMCGECPFRREAAAGWLGANTPEDFAEQAINNPSSLACHMQVNQELKRPEWEIAEAAAPRCRGALTMMRNECKMSRDPDIMTLQRTVPADREKVFSHRVEFIAFHNAAKVKSWKFEEKE